MTVRQVDSFGEAIRRVGLPAGSVIVIGSGILDKLDIRTARDIDLVVDEKEFAKLDGRSNLVRCEDDRGVHYQTADGVIELWRTWGMLGEAERSYEELLPDTVVCDGVRFMSLGYVKRWKRRMGRDKDVRDIDLIERYEATHGR